MSEEELAKLPDGTTVTIHVKGTLWRRTVVARDPVKAAIFRASADDGECICRVEDVARVG